MERDTTAIYRGFSGDKLEGSGRVVEPFVFVGTEVVTEGPMTQYFTAQSHHAGLISVGP